ncbi:hypothetical protein GP486_000510 [Trichoglossum hirsutum]|uniref:Uncharacterized protein n=1 Tax=Trichoglossum hirsutum TaxID=265104 RepID=A0A9P8LHN6_9PEZI|nr:hypothetical protein GP486_000510 [Trichoglossum hirsutum]
MRRPCLEGKQQQSFERTPSTKAMERLEIMHSDPYGPFPQPSIARATDTSSYTLTTTPIFEEYEAYVENATGLDTDSSIPLRQWQGRMAIWHSRIYTACQQNRVRAECIVYTALRMVSASARSEPLRRRHEVCYTMQDSAKHSGQEHAIPWITKRIEVPRLHSKVRLHTKHGVD